MGFSLKPKNTPRAYFYDATITLIATAILFFFLVNTVIEKVQLIQRGTRTEGIVSTSVGAKHHYDIKFTTADERVIQYRESNWATYEDGEKITIIYDPNNPGGNRSSSSFLAFWNGTIILSWLTFICLSISLGLIYFPKYFYGPFSQAYERRQEEAKKRQQSGHA